ncbi:MAG: type II toxin-antitoxin system VapC family toxin [Mycolicibacterium sp.]|uniref:type II toxin-antitoxin system VapC family toxin n=1 Tax=Mycolicibacterium sp. TaxID=2320850 RepID=UPI003D14F800
MSSPTAAKHVVVDASAMVDLLARTADRHRAIRTRLAHTVMHAPAHFDAEVLSALGRMHRSGVLTAAEADAAVEALVQAPVTRHDLTPLLAGAWSLRDSLRVTDAFYAELARQTGLVLLTTDQRLARAWPAAEAIA